MHHRIQTGLVVLGLLGTILAGVIILRGHALAAQPVYSASLVVGDVRLHPEHWRGRTVLIRGVILPLDTIRPMHAADPGQLPEDVAWQNASPIDTFPRGSEAQVALSSHAGLFNPASMLVLWVQERPQLARIRAILRHVPLVARLVGPRLVVRTQGVYSVHFPSSLRWVYGGQPPDGTLFVP